MQVVIPDMPELEPFQPERADRFCIEPQHPFQFVVGYGHVCAQLGEGRKLAFAVGDDAVDTLRHRMPEAYQLIQVLRGHSQPGFGRVCAGVLEQSGCLVQAKVHLLLVRVAEFRVNRLGWRQQG